MVEGFHKDLSEGHYVPKLVAYLRLALLGTAFTFEHLTKVCTFPPVLCLRFSLNKDALDP